MPPQNHRQALYIADGRFSGSTWGVVVGHVAPEVFVACSKKIVITGGHQNTPQISLEDPKGMLRFDIFWLACAHASQPCIHWTSNEFISERNYYRIDDVPHGEEMVALT